MPTHDGPRLLGKRWLRICVSALIWAAIVAGSSLAQDLGAEGQASAVRPAELQDPTVPMKELAHLLVPLTRDELEPLARAWLKIVRSKTEEIAARQVELLRDPLAATAQAHQALAELVEERARLLVRFSMVVDSLESKGGDDAVVRELRAYRESVLASETVLASPRAIARASLAWLSRADGGLAIARVLGIGILALVGLVLVASSIRWLFGRWVSRIESLSRLLQSFLSRAVYWLVLTVGLVVALAALGVNVTPLFAMIGGASFILAFALQDTLGNLASGLMIMLHRPFDLGDSVVVGGTGGTVRSVSIVATTVTTPDNQVIVIPNKSVWGNVITNVTASETRRVDLVFGISYADSIEGTQQLLEQVVARHELVLEDPAPVIRVHELGASSVNFVVRPWTKTEDYWTVYWDLQRAVKEAFDSQGISMPYPQTDVHLHVTRDEE